MGIRLVVADADSNGATELVFEFEQERVVIGRGASSDVRLPHRSVSEHHATIRLEHGRFVLVDESSTNGTFMSGTRLVAGRGKTLKNADVFVIANIPVTFHGGVAVVLPTSAERTAALAKRMLREQLAKASSGLAPPRLVFENHALTLDDRTQQIVLGRDTSNAIVVEDPDASREHALITHDDDGWLVRDLGSKNGTFVNQRNVAEKRLRDGDEIRIGSKVIRFEEPADAALHSLEHVADEPVAPPAVAVPVTEPNPVAEDRLSEVPAAAAMSKPSVPAKNAGKLGVDGVVYAVAGVILVVSLAALALLLR